MLTDILNGLDCKLECKALIKKSMSTNIADDNLLI